jgi:hypothetical protein
MAEIFTLQDVSDIDLAFPAHVMHLMPEYDRIPEEFRRGTTEWNKLVSKWFFQGVQGLRFVPKPGVDNETYRKVMRQFRCILGSFEPQHEHKEAACAYILSCYFESYSIDGEEKTADSGVYVEQTVEPL